MRSAPFEVIVPKQAIRGETGNELEITVRATPAKPVTRIVLRGTYPTTQGPLVSEQEFFTRCLDTTLPAFADIPSRVASGDLAGARKIFADHVRKNLRPDAVLGDWYAKTNMPAAVKSLRKKAALVMDHTLNTLGTSWHFEGPVEWEFNPTYNGYREWNSPTTATASGTTTSPTSTAATRSRSCTSSRMTTPLRARGASFSSPSSPTTRCR